MGSKYFDAITVGGGNSAGYVAREWVSIGTSKKLLVIGEEKVPSYERPALSKAYLAPKNPARLPGFHTSVGAGGERQDAAWYAKHGIEFETGRRVASIDVSRKSVTTSDGTLYRYGSLVLATGARPVKLQDLEVPGGTLPGVLTLRNVEDADALVAAIAAVKEARGEAGAAPEVVVVGGGYIGIEVGAALSDNGLKVTLVFPEDRLLARLLTPELSKRYEDAFRARGITLVKGDVVATVLGRDDGSAVRAVELKSGGELPADLVVVGTGARPASELAQGQLEVLNGPPGGIKVDRRLRTSAEDVYAIGDVAAFPTSAAADAQLGRQEHVTHARLSGAYVARELSEPGKQPDYTYLPFFYSRFWTFSWQLYGVADGDVVHFSEGSEPAARFGAFWVRDGVVKGAFLEGGSGEENNAIKRAVAAGASAPADLAAGPRALEFLASL